jgi:hypothetical protein
MRVHVSLRTAVGRRRVGPGKWKKCEHLSAQSARIATSLRVKCTLMKIIEPLVAQKTAPLLVHFGRPMAGCRCRGRGCRMDSDPPRTSCAARSRMPPPGSKTLRLQQTQSFYGAYSPWECGDEGCWPCLPNLISQGHPVHLPVSRGKGLSGTSRFRHGYVSIPNAHRAGCTRLQCCALPLSMVPSHTYGRREWCAWFEKCLACWKVPSPVGAAPIPIPSSCPDQALPARAPVCVQCLRGSPRVAERRRRDRPEMRANAVSPISSN